MVGQRKEGDTSAASTVDGPSPQSPRLAPPQPYLNVPPLPSESEASSEASGEVKRRRLTVVRGQIPADLEELLTKPFSEEEREHIFDSVGLTTVPQQRKAPIALWLFGPPAAGKTSVSEEVEEDYFGAKGSAVSIDGSHVRDSHTGFQKVLKHGFDHQMIHADAWSKLKATKYVERLKEEIFQRAVQNRQNIKICDAAQKPERVKKMLKSLEDADFQLHAMCLWVPEVAIRSRGQHRSAESGRVVCCSSTYASSSEATLALAKKWDEQIRTDDGHYKSLVLLDNTPRQPLRISLEEFESRTRWSPEEAERHYIELRAEGD